MSGRLSPQVQPGSWPEGLGRALAVFRDEGLAAKLEGIYQQLPPTACQRRGLCCGLLPPVQPIEIIFFIFECCQLAPQERATEAQALVAHFLHNAAQRRPCPWARPGACARYAGRFLACRTYGLWSLAAYQARRQEAQRAQTQVEQAWRSLGIALPASVLAPGPAYCAAVTKVQPGDKCPMDDEALQDLEAQTAGLSQDLPGAQELMACGGDLSYALARLALGERACLEAKVTITRALVQGRPGEAEQALEQARRQVRAWALAWPENEP